MLLGQMEAGGHAPLLSQRERETLFFISFNESVTYIAEFGSLADIFPDSP